MHGWSSGVTFVVAGANKLEARTHDLPESLWP